MKIPFITCKHKKRSGEICGYSYLPRGKRSEKGVIGSLCPKCRRPFKGKKNEKSAV